MFRLEFEFGQVEVVMLLRKLLMAKGRGFEENRKEFGYMLAEAGKGYTYLTGRDTGRW